MLFKGEKSRERAFRPLPVHQGYWLITPGCGAPLGVLK
jgi:hypothetical protein